MKPFESVQVIVESWTYWDPVLITVYDYTGPSLYKNRPNGGD